MDSFATLMHIVNMEGLANQRPWDRLGWEVPNPLETGITTEDCWGIAPCKLPDHPGPWDDFPFVRQGVIDDPTGAH